MNWMGINLVAVLVAGIVHFMLGGLWYSPVLFAKPWMAAMGIDMSDTARLEAMKKNMAAMYTAAFLSGVLAALVLAKLLVVLTIHDPLYGMKVAFAVWLGFVATVQLTGVLFGGQKIQVFFINAAYQLVGYLAMGAILAAWR